MLNTYVPTHKQVKVDGVDVDEGLAKLLESIWEAGIATQFSCQGGTHPAMILFPTVMDGLRFVEETLLVTGTYGCYAGQLNMQIAGPMPGRDGPMRFRVEWASVFTPVWEAAWDGTPLPLDDVLEICEGLEPGHCPVSAWAATNHLVPELLAENNRLRAPELVGLVPTAEPEEGK